MKMAAREALIVHYVYGCIFGFDRGFINYFTICLYH